ncbi:serine/threonine-protein phosphatase 4 regulatory subunit 2 [Daktulosphaira vitifoliae]|uniref:serine/threonine-protein phosphatase 4 regulatory subunit 2 n=1 Tax=Daktulosphaira vitifoliae TaxID=58002 RepID=UPI0021AAB9B0|nr:serine/threonine-protein phosphatase 4 regulatory subunit 2 [Daktulosphaira vitifoliae]
MIENAELIMQMLEMYQMYKQQVPVELEEYLRYVAKTGNTLFQWTLVKPFIREKILNVIAQFTEQTCLADIPPYPNVDPFNYEAMKNMLLERFDTFNGPPFTIQRLCELLSTPRKEYNRVDKFMRAVEKNILVVSTCDLKAKRDETIVNGIPERWENGKETDINMDFVEKNNIISTDVNILNANETVESLLSELESMKTPETKPEENKEQFVNEVSNQEENEFNPKESNNDQQPDNLSLPNSHTTEEPQSKIKEFNEKELSSDEAKEELQETTETKSRELNNEIIKSPLDDCKDLPNEIISNCGESSVNDPVSEENKIEDLNLLVTEPNRIEGSIIHQTPDCDNKQDSQIIQSNDLEEINEEQNNMDICTEDNSKTLNNEEANDDLHSINSTEVQNRESENSIKNESVIEANNSQNYLESNNIENVHEENNKSDINESGITESYTTTEMKDASDEKLTENE